MVVRLKFKSGPTPKSNVVRMRRTAPLLPPQPELVTTREMAAGLASLLSPVAAVVFALAIWRLGQDLGVTTQFFIQDGPLSHWQVWLALAITLGAACMWLNRAGSGGDGSRATN